MKKFLGFNDEYHHAFSDVAYAHAMMMVRCSICMSVVLGHLCRMASIADPVEICRDRILCLGQSLSQCGTVCGRMRF